MSTGHFFFSQQQLELYINQAAIERKVYKPTWALINGEVVKYTELCETNKPSGYWTDYEYLGEGEYLSKSITKPSAP